MRSNQHLQKVSSVAATSTKNITTRLPDPSWNGRKRRRWEQKNKQEAQDRLPTTIVAVSSAAAEVEDITPWEKKSTASNAPRVHTQVRDILSEYQIFTWVLKFWENFIGTFKSGVFGMDHIDNYCLMHCLKKFLINFTNSESSALEKQ